MSLLVAPSRRATLVQRLLHQAQQRGVASRMEAPTDTRSATAAAAAGTGAGTAARRSGGGVAAPKRQRLLAPLPPGKQSGGSSGKGIKKPTHSKPGPAARTAAVYKEPGPGSINLPGGAQLAYRTDLLPASEAAALFRRLREELPWEQRSVRVMGREVQQPRLIAYLADGPELSYTYSGATLAPAPWHPAVAALKARVEAAAGVTFNCCLLNLYRSGADSIAWHSDNERLFGQRPTIASVSLGSPREFLLRSNADPTDKYRFRLGGGALLVMGPGVQEGWMHSVPRRAGATLAERISLTFRTITAPEGSARQAGQGGATHGPA